MSRMVRSTGEVVVMACSFIRGRGLARGRWITGRSGARCRRGGWTHRGDTGGRGGGGRRSGIRRWPPADPSSPSDGGSSRSEEHTSELQSRGHLVCRLLLEKKEKGD